MATDGTLRPGYASIKNKGHSMIKIMKKRFPRLSLIFIIAITVFTLCRADNIMLPIRIGNGLGIVMPQGATQVKLHVPTLKSVTASGKDSRVQLETHG
jgi:hypothetical protein